MDWTPTLSDRQGPVYRRIVEALTEDNASGRLHRGQQLPTHRALAKALAPAGTLSALSTAPVWDLHDVALVRHCIGAERGLTKEMVVQCVPMAVVGRGRAVR